MVKFLLTLACISLLSPKSDACTVFIVGKDASTDGSVMVSHSNDGEFDTDPRLVKIASKTYQEGSMRPIYFSPENYPRYVGTDRSEEYFPADNQTVFKPIGYIPQVKKTFAYLEETYGAVNEMQVGIGESTCSGIFGAIPVGAPNGTALFSVDQLTQIAMERATSAREAIEIIGPLAVEHGFYGAGEFEGTAESLAVSDPQEAWIFHILPDPTGTSAIWAAQRVADDSFSVLANMFVLRDLDPDDADNFLMSESVHSVAQEYGWWKKEDGLLDFTKIYSDGEYAHKFYSGRRMWGGYHLASPSLDFPADYTDLQSDPVYPVYAKPDEKISQLDLFRYHRYTYQNTTFDLGAAGSMAAGPFGSPDRWKAGLGEKEVVGNWERAIGLYRTSDSYVVQSKQNASTGAVLWFGPASALGTVFTPFLVGISDVIASFRSGHHAVFSRRSAFWAACYAHNIATLKWSYAIHDVQARQNQLESESVRLIDELEERFLSEDDWDAVEGAILFNAAKIVEKLWLLSDEIMFKYASGFVNEAPDGLSQMVGYPSWWLQKVGYSDGPPPPPTQPKCCNPEKTAQTLRNAFHDEKRNRLSVLTGKAAMKDFLQKQLGGKVNFAIGTSSA